MFIVVTATLAACSPTAAPERTSHADSTSILVAGDSLAGGYYASSAEKGFVDRVADSIDGPVQVTKATRAHESLAVVSSVAEIPEDVDIAIVELGTNDVGIPTPEAEFREGYASLLDRVRETSPDAKLICIGTWTGWGWTQDETIRSECIARDGAYVHLRDLFDRDELHGPEGVETPVGTSDWFHPNNRGHAAIANRVSTALSELRG